MRTGHTHKVTRRTMLAVSVVAGAVLGLPGAAHAGWATLYQDTFTSALAGRPGWTTGTYKATGDPLFSGTAPEVVFPGPYTTPRRYVSSPGALWIAQDCLGTEDPASVYDNIDGYYDVRIRVTAGAGAGVGALADIDGAQASYGGLHARLESDASTTAVTRSSSPAWSSEAGGRYGGSSTLVADTPGAWVEFVFSGDSGLPSPSAFNPTRRVGLIVGKRGAARSSVDYQLYLRPNTGGSWALSASGSIDETQRLYQESNPSGSRFASNMDGYARYAVDLTAYSGARVRYMWFKPPSTPDTGADWTYVQVVSQSSGNVIETIQSIQPNMWWSRWYEAQSVLSTGAGQQIWLQFRSTSDQAKAGEGVYFDDLTIEGLIADPPGAPAVSSPTHPSEDPWYRSADPTFVWTEPTPTVTDYSWSFDQSPTAQPDTTGEGDTTTTAYSGVADGEHYFHVRAYDAPTWGPTGTRRVRIDRTAPSVPQVSMVVTQTSPTSTLRAMWTSDDTHSGIARYDYAVGTSPGGATVRNWTSTGLEPSVTATGLSLPGPQEYFISVRAIDSAGNTSTVGSPSPGTFVRGQSTVSMPVPSYTAVAGRPVTFNISGTPANASVNIIRRIGGVPSVIGNTTLVGGAGTFTDYPEQHASYWAEVVPNSQWVGSASAADVLRVKWRMGFKPYRWVDRRGRSIRLRGNVFPAPGRRYVYLQRYYGGRWRTIQRIGLGGSGFFYRAYFRLPNRAGSYYLRLWEPADSRHYSGYSRYIRLRAR